jgi:CRISPR-associated endoribonuclease Cas6
MPTLLELRLKASWQVRSDARQLHGLACALFENDGPDHLGQHKPFAVWPLRPAAGGSPDEWTWRAAWLPGTLPPPSAQAPDCLRVGHVSCVVTESTQRRVTHAALAGGPPLSAVTVAFGSPTYFSQNGAVVTLPDPRLIVGSWRRRWDASLGEDASLAIDDDAWRETLRFLQLGSYDLRTERQDNGHGSEREGFTGTATVRLAKDAPALARKILGTLARFAEFGGTGAQTTHGFGATTTTHAPRRAAG